MLIAFSSAVRGAQQCMRVRRRDVRTSQGTFISRYDDPAGVLAWVEEKAAQLTGTPVSHGEVRCRVPLLGG